MEVLVVAKLLSLRQRQGQGQDSPFKGHPMRLQALRQHI